MSDRRVFEFETEGGVKITRERVPTSYEDAVQSYVDRLDSRRGAVFSSNYEYPGRYTRWDTAIIDPPLGIVSKGRRVRIEAYNKRGTVLLAPIAGLFEGHDHIAGMKHNANAINLTVAEPDGIVSEELRSRVPTVFSVLREIVALFRSDEDPNLALYGAFGYDLCFQFDPITFHLDRPEDQRDMVMFLPDEILVVDHHAAQAWHERYEFAIGEADTSGLSRGGAETPFQPADHEPGTRRSRTRRICPACREGEREVHPWRPV